MASFQDVTNTFIQGHTQTNTKDMSFSGNDSLMAILEDICRFSNNEITIPNRNSYTSSLEQPINTQESPDLIRYRSSSLIPVPTAVQDSSLDFNIPGAPRLGQSQRSVSMSALRYDSAPLPNMHSVNSQAEPYMFGQDTRNCDTHTQSGNLNSINTEHPSQVFPHRPLVSPSRPCSRIGSVSDDIGSRPNLGIMKSQSLSDLSNVSPTPYKSALSSLSEAEFSGGSSELYFPGSYTSATEFASSNPGYRLHKNYSTSHTDVSNMGLNMGLNPVSGLHEQIRFQPTLTSCDYLPQIAHGGQHPNDGHVDLKPSQHIPPSINPAPRLSLDSLATPSIYSLPQNKMKIARIQNPATQRQKNKARRASVRRQSAGLNRAYQCPVDNCTRRYEAWRSLQVCSKP
ncbi:hypothetical protein, variant [Sphaeroforma arctica JP610]|uniref:Uncharacterized protein n=1 Tax=Sphaeroforma arctica JP610 TaxID=667725 RepID=A0A0L0G372_9EUKA|nr:hypothetical protein, variant [Sphaeroforma arctica JP610]KNC83525.1 hypothetical protein, variant [Sphaeroforma arctica JP610]|eukprot:XP_014157427.1 hypothetical protein, variant [Sphaeroforma arctica JP610]